MFQSSSVIDFAEIGGFSVGKWARALHLNLTHFKEPTSTHLGDPTSILIKCRGIQWRIAYICIHSAYRWRREV